MFVLIVFNFIMSIWRAPVVALMPDLTPSPLRSQANGVINLMGGVGSILAFVVGGLLSDLWAPAPFFFSGAVMLLALVLLRINVKEPPGEAAIETKEEGEEDKSIGEQPAAEKKARTRSLIFLLLAIFFWFNGYNAVETLFSLYATKSLGVSDGTAAMMLAFFSVTFIAVSIPAGLLANRIGRRQAILIGLAGVTLIFPALILVKNLMVIRLMLLIGGAFWAFVNINSLPMVLQLCAHKDIGKYTGYYYFFSFSASISAPILAGLLRDIVKNYGSVFIYAGVSFLIALLCMLTVRHGDLPAKKQTATEILDQLDG
jgi:Na+/melibiose symporter-like transporter